MDIFGFNITRNTEETVTAAERKSISSKEIGDSGTAIFQGVITEDHNTKLVGTQGIAIYDKMRKGDATVKAAILATSLPIRRASWFVEPASEDEADQKIATFIESALFDWMTITWDDLLRQALLSLPFGVMLFEKVFTIKEVDGQNFVIWKKFAPRLPKTVFAWQTSNGKDGIQQIKNDGGTVDIPIDRLLIFVNEKEGDNWWGNSILRAAYKHWRFKDGFYNIDAVAFERQGLGIPKAKMPENYSEEDRTRAITILKNLRAHEEQYILEPSDIEFEFMDMKANSTRNPKDSIMHHNREITKAVLAQFLELGATNSGSRSLSTDQTDLFLQSLEAVAGNFADVFNTFAIPQLVDMNFDNVTDYPKLRVENISRQSAEGISTAYKTLIEAGGLAKSEKDEQHFREMLGLPARDEDDEPIPIKPESVDEDTTDDVLDEVGMSDFTSDVKKKIYPTRQQIETAVWRRCSEQSEPVTWLKRAISFTGDNYKHETFFSTVRSVLGARLADEERRAFADENDFKPENKDFKRPLTFAEGKVDFNAIQAAMNKFEKGLTDEAQVVFQKDSQRFMKELSRAVNNDDMAAVKKATLRIKATYAGILKTFFKQSFEFGKNNSSKEMGVSTPPNPNNMLRQIDLAAATVAERHATEISTETKLALNEALQKGETAAVALAAADKRLRGAIEKRIKATAEIAVTGYLNHGRRLTFDTNSELIYALQRSELLDASTCNFCLSIDGRIVEKTDDFGRNTIFHSGCRGIWVEILQDEEKKPPIDGIPDSLRNRFGDAVNDLIQPRTPFNKKKNTDAKKEIKKRRDNRIKRQS